MCRAQGKQRCYLQVIRHEISEKLIYDCSGFSSHEKHALLQKIPLGRFGEPTEVAEAASFLALNEYANNCVINLDGGLSAYL